MDNILHLLEDNNCIHARNTDMGTVSGDTGVGTVSTGTEVDTVSADTGVDTVSADFEVDIFSENTGVGTAYADTGLLTSSGTPITTAGNRNGILSVYPYKSRPEAHETLEKMRVTDRYDYSTLDPLTKYFGCTRCLQSFQTVELCNDHICVGTVGSKLKKNVTYFLKCEKCSLMFKSKQELREHLALECLGVDQSEVRILYNEDNGEEPETSVKGSKAGGIPCSDTPMEVESTSIEKPKRSRRKLPPVSYRVTDDPRYPMGCLYCDYSCPNSTALRTHYNIHKGELPYECEECGHKFRNQARLSKHKERHDGTMRFRCMGCSRKFWMLQNLKRHVFRIHSSHKPYECLMCHRRFKEADGVRKHIEVFGTERGVYKCNRRCSNKSKCPEVFECKCQLRYHKLLIHPYVIYGRERINWEQKHGRKWPLDTPLFRDTGDRVSKNQDDGKQTTENQTNTQHQENNDGSMKQNTTKSGIVSGAIRPVTLFPKFQTVEALQTHTSKTETAKDQAAIDPTLTVTQRSPAHSKSYDPDEKNNEKECYKQMQLVNLKRLKEDPKEKVKEADKNIQTASNLNLVEETRSEPSRSKGMLIECLTESSEETTLIKENHNAKKIPRTVDVTENGQEPAVMTINAITELDQNHIGDSMSESGRSEDMFIENLSKSCEKNRIRMKSNPKKIPKTMDIEIEAEKGQEPAVMMIKTITELHPEILKIVKTAPLNLSPTLNPAIPVLINPAYSEAVTQLQELKNKATKKTEGRFDSTKLQFEKDRVKCKQCNEYFYTHYSATNHVCRFGMNPVKCSECDLCFVNEECLDWHVTKRHKSAGNKKRKAKPSVVSESVEATAEQRPKQVQEKRPSFDSNGSEAYDATQDEVTSLETADGDIRKSGRKRKVKDFGDEFVVGKAKKMKKEMTLDELSKETNDVLGDIDAELDDLEFTITQNESIDESSEDEETFTHRRASTTFSEKLPLRIKCNLCDEWASDLDTFNKHMVEAYGCRKLRTCPWCKKRYVNKEKLEEHVRSQHKDMKTVCIVCKIRLESVTAKVAHLKSHIYHKLPRRIGNKIAEAKKRLDKDKTDDKQAKTPRITRAVSRKNYEEDSDEELDETEVSDSGRNSTRTPRSSTRKQNNEDINKLNTNSLSETSIALLFVKGSKQATKAATCKLCSKLVPRNRMKKHFDHHNSGCKVQLFADSKLEYPCPTCPEIFEDLEAFQMHLEQLHKDQDLRIPEERQKEIATKKVHPCSVCKKMFQRKSEVEIHEVTHTSAQPYNCSYCERKFNRISNKNRHERVHFGFSDTQLRRDGPKRKVGRPRKYIEDL